MIKSALKNYFRYFKYIFAVMGAVYLGIFISAFFLGGGFLRIFGDELEKSYVNIFEYVSGVSESVKLNKILSKDFINQFFREIGQMLHATRGEAGGIAVYAAASAAVIVIFCQISKGICRALIKSEAAGACAKRGFIVFVIRTAVSAVFAAAFFLLGWLWIWSAVILAVTGVILQASANLVYARVIYSPHAPLKAFFKPKVIWLNTLANLLTLMITAVFAAAVWLAFNPFVALILAVPLVMYGMTVAEFAAVENFKTSPFSLCETAQDPSKETGEGKRKTG